MLAKRYYTLPFVLGALIVAIAIGFVLDNGRAETSLQNDSGAVITAATIRVDDDERAFTNIGSGETRRAVFTVSSDASYEVFVRLANGKELSMNDGYLANGVNSVAVITVTANDIGIAIRYE